MAEELVYLRLSRDGRLGLGFTYADSATTAPAADLDAAVDAAIWRATSPSARRGAGGRRLRSRPVGGRNALRAAGIARFLSGESGCRNPVLASTLSFVDAANRTTAFVRIFNFGQDWFFT